MTIKAVIIGKDNKHIHVGYFKRVNDDYDLKVAERSYTLKDIKELIDEDKTRKIGEFLRDKNIGDVFNF